MPKKLSQEDAKERMEVLGFSLLSVFQGYNVPSLIRCNTCQHEWEANTKNVMLGRTGCPECNRKSKTIPLEDVNKRLFQKNIRMIGSYVSSSHKTELKCTVCGYEWITSTTQILHSGSGCPHCAGNLLLTHEQVQDRLPSSISLVGDYVGINKKTKFACSLGHTWNTQPANILHNHSACPVCSPYIPNKGFGRRVVVDDHVCRSTFEAECYKVVSESGIIFEMQKKYPTSSRKRCDFFFPEKSIWVEVSKFKNEKYLQKIKTKKSLIENIGERFIFVFTIPQLKRIILELK